MRLKVLQDLPASKGGHKAGDFITVDDDKLAKQYIALELAEEAAEADTKLAAFTATIEKAIEKGIAAGVAAATAKASGTDPKHPNNAMRVDAGESSLDRQKSFGHQLQLIGRACHPQSGATQIAEANDLLEKMYSSTFNPWDSKQASNVFKASTQVENSGPLGGYGVYPEYSTEIYKIAIEATILASRARKRPMTTNTFIFPKLDQTGTNTAGKYTGYLGGVIAGWGNESLSAPQTNAQLKMGTLKAGELMGYTTISNELLSDNEVGLESMLRELFAEAIAYYTDLATLVGDGVDKPTGVVGAGPTLGVSRGGGANTVIYDDLVKMKAKLLSESEKNAFWVFNKTVQPQLYLMKDGANRNIWLPNLNGSDQGPVTFDANRRILDLPYFFTEKTPVLGSSGDVLLIDPQGYLVGERMGLEIAASPHVNFLNRLMTYRFVARVAGQPMLDKPFTMLDGTNQLSTFVQLN